MQALGCVGVEQNGSPRGFQALEGPALVGGQALRLSSVKGVTGLRSHVVGQREWRSWMCARVWGVTEEDHTHKIKNRPS